MAMLDALIIGAGPAGLTAATYLARFRRDALLVDDGASRARYIPVTRNTPGFPGGICGEDLLADLREQAARFGTVPRTAHVETLRVNEERTFEAALAGGEVLQSRAIVLATGVEDVLPMVDGVEDAIRSGIVRLCSVCDGFETDGKRVAVYGPAEKASSHARFHRTFSDRVTVVTSDGGCPPDAEELRELTIEIIDDATGLRWNGGKAFHVVRRDGTLAEFDAFYPVLGLRSRSALATSIGARCSDTGELFTDSHQQTSIEGLFAIGDVVADLSQISVAYGHAAVAATAIHNRLPRNPRA